MGKLKTLLHDFWLTADPTRIEVAMRITLACFIAYCLSIADIPKAVPVSTSYVVGSVGATLAIVAPTIMFSVSLVLPMVINVFLVAMIVSTALLAAGTVSDGLLVAMQAVITWVMTGCFFGEDVQVTAQFINGIIAITAFLTLSYLPLVQDGFSTTVTHGAVEQGVGEIADWVRAALSAACDRADQAPDCWEDRFPTVADGFLTVELPAAAGDLAGQTAYLTASPDASTITIDVPGGLWVVSGLWTWKGIDNPLAGNRNFLIALAWGCACVLAGILFPRVRTSRNFLSKGLVPSVLCVTAESDSLELVDKNKGRLLHGLSTMNGGKAAVVTTFEPRIFTAPFEYIVPLLKDLLVATEQAALATYCLLVWNKDNGESDETTNDLHDELSVLSVCAKALASSEGATTESLKELKADARRTLVQEGHSLLAPPNFFRGRCDKVLDATIAWLDALNQPQHPRPCSKEASINLLHTYLPWVLVQLSGMKRMVVTLTLPFRPKAWNWRDTLWSLKFTVGCVALFAASVYADNYGDFAIQTSNGTSGAVYSGWQMLAYIFTFQATMECTVKKGLLRGLGTCLGGFMAWLGVIVCSWSYDDDAEINPYGFIAWLTIASGIAGYFTVEPGMAARLGKSYDHGFIGEYFVLTLAYIGLEVYRGIGSRNALTANRVVANLCGIVLAMIVAVIPPTRKGGDPKHSYEYWIALRDAFVHLLQILLKEDERGTIKGDDFKASFVKYASCKRRNALYLMKNAGNLKALPFLQVDERLVPLTESLHAVETLLVYLLEFAAEIVGREDVVNSFPAGSKARDEVVQLLKAFDVQEDRADDGQPGPTEEPLRQGSGDLEEPRQDPGAEDVLSFLVMARAISDRLHVHEAALIEVSSQKQPGKKTGTEKDEISL